MWKKFLIAVAAKPALMMVMLGVCLVISITLNTCQFLKQEKRNKRIAQIANTSENGNAIIQKKYTDVNGAIHTVIKEVTVASLAEKSMAVGRSYLDTVTKALKIAGKQIDELTRVNGLMTARIKLLEKIVPDKDSAGVAGSEKVKQYQNQYLYVRYDSDTDSLLLRYNVLLNTVKYHKRKNWLAVRQYYIDLYSDDPRVTINSVKRFSSQFVEKPKRFGIGPNISYSYNYYDRKFYPTIGIGIQYNLIRF